MARQKPDVIAQREQLRTNGVQQLGKTAVGVLPCADRVPEQDVANKGLSARSTKVSDMSFGVPWAMKHFDNLFSEAHLISII